MAQDLTTLELAVTLMGVELLTSSPEPVVTRVKHRLVRDHRVSEDQAAECAEMAHQRYLDGMR